MRWWECDDEMKMADFLEQVDDEANLHRFALEMACTVSDSLKDQRFIDAIDATEDYLNGAITAEQLEPFHDQVSQALEEIEIKECEDFEKGIEDDESMAYETGLVVLYAATPRSSEYYKSSIDAARDIALHSAYYCMKVRGETDLHNQEEVMKTIGLPIWTESKRNTAW